MYGSASPERMNLSQYLLVDIGNTRVKWAVADFPSFPRDGTPKLAVRTPIETLRIRGEIATSEATPERIQALAKEFSQHYLVLASVVPKHNAALCRAFKRRHHLVIGTSPALGLQFDYPSPAEIGADRLAVAVRVKSDGVWPIIVVQCGTATAFTVLDRQGQFCGGAIAPGPQAQLTALTSSTALLPDVAPGLPKRCLARSTEEAIQAGVMFSYLGGVKETLRRLIAELAGTRQPRVALTGGYAHFLAGSLDLPHTLRPLLVFEGLHMIGVRAWYPQLFDL